MTLRTIRHDFRHHNQNIVALLQKGESREALRYVEQYNESLDTAKPKVFCPHATVNAILSSFSIKAQKDALRFRRLRIRSRIRPLQTSILSPFFPIFWKML